MRNLMLVPLWLKFATLAFLGVVPVDLQLFSAVENRIAAGPSKIIPGPFHKSFDPCAGGGKQSGVYSQPGGEGDGAVNLKSMLSHFGYARVLSDDGHDALVQIVERDSWLSLNFQQNIFAAALAGLFRDRGQLGQG